MQTIHEGVFSRQHNLNETLSAVLSLRVPQVFNFDHLVEQADRGEWSGLWW